MANGEIGIVVGSIKNRSRYKWTPFEISKSSSAPSRQYKYTTGDGTRRRHVIRTPRTRLRDHRPQGAGQRIWHRVLVLPKPCRLLSRELLYTALTRQQGRLVILHQGDLTDLRAYTSSLESETARRYTNVFAPPIWSMCVVASMRRT